MGILYSSSVQRAPNLVPFIAPEALERQLGIQFDLRLGANESAFGPSPRVGEALGRVNAAYYGDPQSIELRTALTPSGGQIANVLVASGIDELLGLFCRLLLDPGDLVVSTFGTYPTLEFAVHAAGGTVERVPYAHDAPDLDRLLEEAHSKQAKILYLANPDNPSGALIAREKIEALIEALPGDCVLLLDEAYIDFVPEAERPVVSLERENVVRLRTFSKAHGLAGLRVGYALAHRTHLETMDRIRLHFGVNSAGQAAALASWGDVAHVRWVVEETIRQRQRLSDLGVQCGWTPLPSGTNFVTFALESAEEANRMLKRLLQAGVFIRKPAAPPLDRCVRITVGTGHQMGALERRLAELDLLG